MAPMTVAGKTAAERGVAYFLVKSEPGVYAWANLVRDKKTAWDGVRNFEARNTLRAMKKGDLLLYYHSGDDKSVVGIARVVREAYADPTAPDEDWSVVDIAPVKKLAKPVTLAAIRAEKSLVDFALVKRGRLSVVPATQAEFEKVLALAGTKP
jgi:predicted RNA-binding protein with PUA-like domain